MELVPPVMIAANRRDDLLGLGGMTLGIWMASLSTTAPWCSEGEALLAVDSGTS